MLTDDTLRARLENWKFDQALARTAALPDVPVDVLGCITVLALMFGNVGHFEGDMADLVEIAVVGLLRERPDMPDPSHHPMQAIALDANGQPRFRPNAIVRLLLDRGPFDMNELARMDFTTEDREQFAQLIGYSVGGFGELSYASEATVAQADAIAAELRRPKEEK